MKRILLALVTTLVFGSATYAGQIVYSDPVPQAVVTKASLVMGEYEGIFSRAGRFMQDYAETYDIYRTRAQVAPDAMNKLTHLRAQIESVQMEAKWHVDHSTDNKIGVINLRKLIVQIDQFMAKYARYDSVDDALVSEVFDLKAALRGTNNAMEDGFAAVAADKLVQQQWNTQAVASMTANKKAIAKTGADLLALGDELDNKMLGVDERFLGVDERFDKTDRNIERVAKGVDLLSGNAAADLPRIIEGEIVLIGDNEFIKVENKSLPRALRTLRGDALYFPLKEIGKKGIAYAFDSKVAYNSKGKVSNRFDNGFMYKIMDNQDLDGNIRAHRGDRTTGPRVVNEDGSRVANIIDTLDRLDDQDLILANATYDLAKIVKVYGKSLVLTQDVVNELFGDKLANIEDELEIVNEALTNVKLEYDAKSGEIKVIPNDEAAAKIKANNAERRAGERKIVRDERKAERKAKARAAEMEDDDL